jgi:hypothetical protein
VTAAVVDLASSSTPREPDPKAVAAARGQKVAEAAKLMPHEAHPHHTVTLGRRAAYSVVQEADGTVLVSDREHQVVGSGETISAALGDFHAALRQWVNYLRANRGRLHHRLVEELQRLERDFPWI